VRSTDPETGEVTVYADADQEYPDPDDPDTEIRSFDCMDCHNRPSHSFQPPATSLNLELTNGNLSSELPFIRRLGLDLLNAEYETHDEATAAIDEGLQDFYATEYPDQVDDLADRIRQAAEVLQRIYLNNFFPEYKTDYRARTNNLSHFVNDGCFRCHTTELETATGVQISSDCESCHAIVAQGPTADLRELEDDLLGLEFEHPANIGEVWRTIKCTQCHTPASGY
ncbi:MAG: hypothetical protein KJO84_01370, partial [Acidimicrobiia bacterium]|nr:hypothetical protein [Acidimicrobiia bacterium]